MIFYVKKDIVFVINENNIYVNPFVDFNVAKTNVKKKKEIVGNYNEEKDAKKVEDKNKVID